MVPHTFVLGVWVASWPVNQSPAWVQVASVSCLCRARVVELLLCYCSMLIEYSCRTMNGHRAVSGHLKPHSKEVPMEQLCSLLQTGSIDVVQLPEPILLHVLSLNEHDCVWARQVCKAARDAFPHTTAVPVTAPMPVWAFQWMWHNKTPAEHITKVVAGRAAAADLPALAWLKSSSAHSSSGSSDTAQLFGPAVCASAAGAGHIHVLQWLRCADS
jgi:hypothetical protein